MGLALLFGPPIFLSAGMVLWLIFKDVVRRGR